MSEENRIVHVAGEAMGGDNAPGHIIQGAVDALTANQNLCITLVGLQDVVEKELAAYTYPKERLQILHASEQIEMAEPPVHAIQTKKDSSMVRGMKLVREGSCDAFVTAGSTGATLVGGQVLVGRLKGIERPPLAPLMPTRKGPALLIDCGANMDARPSWLVQYAQMGSIYMESIVGIRNPRVAIANVGTEEEKGNALVKETLPLLKECEGINFIGSIEARDIPAGEADVIVCDAFVGNMILKMYEGVASVLLAEIKEALMSSTAGKIGGLLIKPSLKKTLKKFSTSTYGGAPLLGLRGLVVKAHGNSGAIEIQHSIEQCIEFSTQDVTEKFRTRMHLVDRTAGAKES
ncbi:MAG: phosphate acyltransferase PlsX [Lachnospiraceae bacterium]|nr:phosphate acyltransferase PlsX [Lachnospiraceae bacterium]